ncbi:MAG: hypothetical protein WC319_02815 [Candidatus Paceibacterota bacterium]
MIAFIVGTIFWCFLGDKKIKFPKVNKKITTVFILLIILVAVSGIYYFINKEIKNIQTDEKNIKEEILPQQTTDNIENKQSEKTPIDGECADMVYPILLDYDNYCKKGRPSDVDKNKSWECYGTDGGKNALCFWKFTEQEVKSYYNAKEIESINWPYSITFWREGDCLSYQSPGRFEVLCEKGEINSHGGCLTCEMSKITLRSNCEGACSLEEVIKESFLGYKTPEEKLLQGGYPFFANYDAERHPIKNFKDIDYKKIADGLYSKEELKTLFSKYYSVNKIEFVNGKINDSYEGNSAVVSVLYNNYQKFIIIISGDKEPKFFSLEGDGHDVININPEKTLNFGSKTFFEGLYGSYGGSCVGGGGSEYYCRIKEQNLFCYDVGSYYSGSGCSIGETFTNYEVKDVDNDGINELVVKAMAKYSYREKEYLEKTYKLDVNDNLKLIDWKIIN